MGEENSFDVRLIDNGEIVDRPSSEIYEIPDEFKSFPQQAYVLHLVGIIPIDSEDDWADTITTKLHNHLTNLEKTTEYWQFEAHNMFQLRNIFVTKMIRAVDSSAGVLLISIIEHLVDGQLAVKSIEKRGKAINMAQANGINEVDLGEMLSNIHRTVSTFLSK